MARISAQSFWKATRQGTALLVLLAGMASAGAQDVTPLPHAHAHNDYEHERPLLDALDLGFCNAEADIWLVDGKLLVAHNLRDTDSERTLERLYLDPLMKRVQENGGRVYRDGPEFTLLVDIKSRGSRTWPVLSKTLKRYRSMLTVVTQGKLEPGAVRIVASGSRPRELMLAESVLYAGYDGRIADLPSDLPASFMPWISASWNQRYPSSKISPLHEDLHYDVQLLADTAHAKGRKLRFWATPEDETMWAELLELGVDLIGTDDLPRLHKFLAGRK